MSSFTEVFDCGTGIPGLGSFDVMFLPGTQQRVLGPYVASTGNGEREGPVQNIGHDTLLVTPGRLSPGADRATVLAAAIYGGEILRVKGQRGGGWQISGVNATLNWLGDADQKGPGIVQGTDYTTGAPYTGSVADYLLALEVGNYTNEVTFDATAASVPVTALNCAIRWHDVVRERINQICKAKSVEFWPSPDFSVDFAGAGDTTNALFQWTPKVLFAEGFPFSRESGMVSFPCEIIPDFDFGTEADTVAAANSDGSGTVSASVGSALLPNTTDGTGDGDRTKFLGASDELVDQGYNAATERYRRTDSVEITVDSKTLRHDIKPGDFCYVQSDTWQIIDPTVAFYHAGRSCQPVKKRVSEMRTPITRENGVYILHQSSAYGGVNAVQDITDDIAPDTGNATIRIATGSPLTLKAAVLGSQHYERWDRA